MGVLQQKKRSTSETKSPRQVLFQTEFEEERMKRFFLFVLFELGLFCHSKMMLSAFQNVCFFCVMAYLIGFFVSPGLSN